MHAKVEEHLWQWLYATEGAVPFMYADTLGLVTVGIGLMIEPIEKQVDPLVGQFLDSAGNKPDRAAIVKEFERVKDLGQKALKGRRHTAYEAGAQMWMQQNFIKSNVGRVLRLKEAALKSKSSWMGAFFGDLDTFPADAQMCLLSTAYGSMLDKPGSLHDFNVACKERRWLDASKSGRWKGWTSEKILGHTLMMENAQVAQDIGDTNPEPSFPGRLSTSGYEIDDQIKPYGKNVWTAGS